ncbi:FAD-linked oxidase-like protein [Irpex rosettiformis]|uniref:FAD-linked oxidase-like protein n=1 Tax=Irpex rosettiformis TaxID=378272 RepID=A0ACB8U6H2_9APHY|nr:FAD-linked oxidase-like protein [Irpex rosettiformis]
MPAQVLANSSVVHLNDQYGTEADYQNAVKELVQGLPGSTSTDKSVLEAHGKSFGDKQARTVPTIVVFAQSTQDVVLAVNVSRKYRVPIIAYSGATSLERNHVATKIGGICVDVSGMNRILEIHEEDGDLVAQAGAKWVDINATLKEKGIPLFFPLDPSLGATLGGMMGCGCSGTNAVRYGTARAEWFLNATVVLPSGEVIKTRRRARKCSAGFDGTHLFIGAEGTLGIVTEMTIRLAPVLPTRVAVVQFPDVHTASKAAIRLLNSGVGIQCMELVDKIGMRALNLIALDLGRRATWTESDGLFFKLQGPTPLMLEETARVVREVSEMYGGTNFEYAQTEEEAVGLWEVRKHAMHAGAKLFPGLGHITTDVCVPISRLPDLIHETKLDFEKLGLYGIMGGHIGDGNFHSMMVYRSEEEHVKVDEACRRLVHRAIALDGTCTGEHGVGEGKRKYLVGELGQGTVDFIKTIKQTLDPLNLFNPGKLYPD